MAINEPEAGVSVVAPPGQTVPDSRFEPQMREILNETLNAMERLIRLFQWERMLHLGIGVLAFVMLLVAGGVWLMKGELDGTNLLLMFGSSGLITVSAARVTFFFNRAFVLIDDIVRTLVNSAREGRS
jgi:hypothetical protein